MGLHLALLTGCIVMAARFDDIQKGLRVLLVILPAAALLATGVLTWALLALAAAASC
jgi:hypothetical protein